MLLFKSIELIQQIDFLIRTRSTGCALDLAIRLGVSRRTVYNYLNDLKELGAPLSWCYHQNSYVYPEGYKIEIRINDGKNIINEKKTWPAGSINN